MKMYRNNVAPIVAAAERRVMLEGKRRRRLKRKGSAAIRQEEEEFRNLRRRVAPFIDGAALEVARGAECSDGVAESGLRQAFADLLPRDSTGKPYLIFRFPTCCLANIKSDEWINLSLEEQAVVRKKAKRYHRIKFMIEGRL